MADLSEKEQIDALRAWWSEYGTSVLGGVFIAVAGIFGWNQWKNSIAEAEVAASTLFEDVMVAADRGNLDAAAVAADELFNEHGKSAYAAQARLAMARLYMDNGRDQDAANVLRALVERGGKSELALVGRLRLAKILLYQDKPQEVLDLLKGQTDSAFAARFSEVMGDAHVALGNYAEAEAAYIAAMNDNPLARTVDVSLIQLKLNDLPSLTDATQAAQATAPVEEAAADEPAATDDSAAAEIPEQGSN